MFEIRQDRYDETPKISIGFWHGALKPAAHRGQRNGPMAGDTECPICSPRMRAFQDLLNPPKKVDITNDHLQWKSLKITWAILRQESLLMHFITIQLGETAPRATEQCRAALGKVHVWKIRFTQSQSGLLSKMGLELPKIEIYVTMTYYEYNNVWTLENACVLNSYQWIIMII